VADTGPGIKPEDVPLLFEKYRRAAGARRKEGMGLGLFIVKTLVECQGGRVEVESTAGGGTQFHVILPAE
jgi:adenylate cyclase